MTSSRNQDNEGKKPTGRSPASVSPKRRRLIKGLAAAAPGIFTLYSGNAQAMLSSYQCTEHSFDAFSGDQEFAGEEHMVESFARLAEGDGIHVVWTDPDDPDKTEDKWLVMVMDNADVPHYIEAGYRAGRSGNIKEGITWNDSLAGVEWLPAGDSGAGVFGSPLKLIDPSSSLSDPDIYVQDFKETKKIQVLACIDDSGNIVSAYPQDCEALGLTPPSGSCWASIGTSSMNTWWG
jgi:hypothetical protein